MSRTLYRRSGPQSTAVISENARRRQRRDERDRKVSAQLAPIVAQMCRAPLGWKP